MSIGSISSLSSTYLQSILSTAGVGRTNNRNSLSGIDQSSVSWQPDSTQLSPFAQVLGTLQQLQQANPSQYQQVTQQIATNLQQAAQTAQSEGNTTAAGQLNQLAGDFTTASQNGQLPNITDLAQAIGGGGHHHHHHHHGASGSNASNNAMQTLSALLSAFQANAMQTSALNPANIIMNTLSSSGIGPSGN